MTSRATGSCDHVATDDGLASDAVPRAIESRRPMHPTYAGHLYHAMTDGRLLGEVTHQVGAAMSGRFSRREPGNVSFGGPAIQAAGA